MNSKLTKLTKRVDDLEGATQATQEKPKIHTIEIFGDRGNGQELLNTWRWKDGKFEEDIEHETTR